MTDSVIGVRIKTDGAASSSIVSGVTYTGRVTCLDRHHICRVDPFPPEGNTISRISRFGVIMDQSYPMTLGKPGNGVHISVSLSLFPVSWAGA